MYPRLLQPPPKQSYFLFGPRGVGKTAWAHQQFPHALFFDLLDHQTYTQLLAAPQRLGDRIPQGHERILPDREAMRALLREHELPLVVA